VKEKKKKYISADEALARLQKYCAYQERCHQEVRRKLLDLGIYGDTLEEIIAELISDNFLNELRFAESYVRGKYRLKKWGKIRLLQELKRRKISEYCIKKAMQQVEEIDYEETIKALILKKEKTIREKDPFKKNGKIARYLIQKGYESYIVWRVIKSLQSDN